MITFPAFPVHTISIGRVIATKYKPLRFDAWHVLYHFERNGAVTVSVMIVIVISSGEWPIMRERGTSVS